MPEITATGWRARALPRVVLAAFVVVVACRRAPTPTTPASPTPEATAHDASSSEAQTPSDASVPDASVEDAASSMEDGSVSGASTTSVPLCIAVSIGLDLRVLGGNEPPPSATSAFVRGEVDDFRTAAGTPFPPAMYTQEGVGGFTAVFEGQSERVMRGRCQRAVRDYIRHAPRVPIIMTPAASVTTPCGPCP